MPAILNEVIVQGQCLQRTLRLIVEQLVRLQRIIGITQRYHPVDTLQLKYLVHFQAQNPENLRPVSYRLQFLRQALQNIFRLIPAAHKAPPGGAHQKQFKPVDVERPHQGQQADKRQADGGLGIGKLEGQVEARHCKTGHNHLGGIPVHHHADIHQVVFAEGVGKEQGRENGAKMAQYQPVVIAHHDQHKIKKGPEGNEQPQAGQHIAEAGSILRITTIAQQQIGDHQQAQEHQIKGIDDVTGAIHKHHFLVL